ncbi:MAG: type I restriction endonuclease subunit R, partial [Candidatus Heimdallarchaeaceae archaeon]
MPYSEEELELLCVKEFKEIYNDTKDLEHEQFQGVNFFQRETSSEVVFKEYLRERLVEFNEAPHHVIDFAIEELTKDRSSLSFENANKEIYYQLKNGITISTHDEKGDNRDYRIKVIDWDRPERNHFLAVRQMKVSSDLYPRIPDVILFVNGLPLVVIEFKKSTVKVREGFDKNITDYKDTIPHLFWYNAFIIVSNGYDTRLGTITAPWEHFSEWNRTPDIPDKDMISIEKIIHGICAPKKLIDLVENFILFTQIKGKPVKILAKNHQYNGVNKTVQAFIEAKEKKTDKLGVFWHTTGSGKSFSMIFFSNYVFRKLHGNYTFLIVTDRDDLDDQIFKNFDRSDALYEKENIIRAKNSKHLRRLLREDHRHVFTLVHKFRVKQKKDKEGTIIFKEEYPVLSERDDIIVLCDEAHRTQYGDYAANMRKALPNALFLAFTATPLFVDDQKTRAIFGDYVSVYNFQQSIDDGATVPLFYLNKKPEVEVVDENLDPKIVKLIEDAGLNEEEVEKLRRKYPKKYQIFVNNTRLELVAKIIVDHFIGRGYQGKAMVISIDRFTSVTMYEKVQFYWKEKIKELETKIQQTSGTEKEELQNTIDYMIETDMAVVISRSQNEVKDFKKKGIDITPIRERIEYGNLDEDFKDPDNSLRIVFICAMWITGFDAPPVSTIYLDKPMKNHTLMQTISRANRVFPGKKAGVIVDFYGIFDNIEEALAIYGPDSGVGTGTPPIRDIKELLEKLEKDLEIMKKYFLDRDFDPTIILSKQGFEQYRLIKQAMEIVQESEDRRVLFFSLLRLVINAYTDVLPDKKAIKYRPLVSLYVHIGESIVAQIPEIDISDIEQRIAHLIDRSIAVKPYTPSKEEPIDLSKIDLSKIEVSFGEGYQRTEVEKLRSIVNRKLADLLRKNRYRIDFQERLEKLVDDYNSGTINITEYFKRLEQMISALQEEEQRYIREGLDDEEQLAIYDILTRPEPKLTNKEEILVKNASKKLLEMLKEQKLVLDWKKKTQTRADLQITIEDMLFQELPDEKYPEAMIINKSNL